MKNGRLDFDYQELRAHLDSCRASRVMNHISVNYCDALYDLEQFFLDKLKLTIVTKETSCE